VTFQSHDNNFTSCAKVTPLIVSQKKKKIITNKIHFRGKIRMNSKTPSKLSLIFT
jgi:hypothetical protein